MRRILTVTFTAALVLPAAPSGAITYGEPDGDAHPNVGALIAEWRDPGVKEHLCSGTLIDEDVFLTAAHCTDFLESEGISEVWVSFDRDVDPITRKSKLIPGSYVTNPAYTHAQSDPGDLAVVLLSKRVGSAPGLLPTIGRFDEMRRSGTLQTTGFTAVGYGVHEPETGGGPPRFPYDGERWRSVSSFDALNDAWLRLKQNAATGDGGTCFGDSGGPNFLGAGASETRVIASVTITGDAMCKATNTTLRLDTRAAHSFIQPYLD